MRILILVIAISPILYGQDSSRIVPHLAQPRSIFDTWIYIANDTDVLQAYTFTPYDRNGELLERISGEVDPFSVVVRKSTQVFDSPLAAWFMIEGSVNVSILYQSPFFETMRTFVHETQIKARRFRVYASDWDRVFDGLAAVNANQTPANLTVTHYTFTKEEIATRRWEQDQAIPAMGKAQIILGDPFGNGFQYQPNTYVELVSDQPLTIMALAGEMPMEQGSRMWTLDFSVLEQAQ